MTAVERRLRGTRRALVTAVIVRALLWGVAIAVLALSLAAALDLLLGLPLGVRRAVPALVAALGIGTAALVALRGGLRPSIESTALWVESRVPRLEYALVTAAERPGTVPAAEAVAARERWDGEVRRASGRAMLAPLAIGAIALAGLLLLPAGARARVVSPRPGDTVERPVLGEPIDRLSPIAVTVTPPAYAQQAARTEDDPSSVRGLVGSAVTVRGRGDAQGLAAVLGEAAVRVSESDGRWRVSLAMPARPAALRLRDGARERLLLLVPRPDSAPVVTLELPARDSVLRTGTGTVRLAADAADDVGLASASFEWIVSSGSGESFTFRSGAVGSRAVGGRATELAAALSLDSLRLKAGDVVHLSAIARDRNDVSGPGVGRSDTRTFRIARTGEYDSVSVEPAPPPDADKSVLSQRMLLIQTQELQERRPRLSRERLVQESRAIAADQKKLRKQVGEIIFARLGEGGGAEHSHEGEDEATHAAHASDSARSPEQALLAAAERANRAAGEEQVLDFHEDESPVVAINRPLLEAFNHMWDAASELDIGEPGNAIPPMRRALEAIQRARQAERIYLRGRPPAVIVDIARVRLAGKGPDAPPTSRTARPALSEGARRRVERLGTAIELLGHDPQPAIDSLLLVRLDALTEAPVLAEALGEAIEQLRTGKDATEALVRARRAAAGEPRRESTLPAWSSLP